MNPEHKTDADAPPRRGESRDVSADPPPKRGEDPGPEGPEGERVGEDEDVPAEATSDREPNGLGPQTGGPDANPIDPRVF